MTAGSITAEPILRLSGEKGLFRLVQVNETLPRVGFNIAVYDAS
jgi:hypothetical protein